MATERDFEWDDEKNARCMAERGFDFFYAVQIFEGPVCEKPDTRQDYSEIRIRAVGTISGQLFMVSVRCEGRLCALSWRARCMKRSGQDGTSGNE